MKKEIIPPVVGEWARKYADEARHPLDVNTWHGKLSNELYHRARAGYYAYLAYIDAQIGRLVEYLGCTGQKNNTMFIFTSDHGEMLGDHNLWRKTYPYDASARIPFIIKPPSDWKVDRNTTCRQLVGLEDIMPTLLEAAGVSVPRTVEGRSLAPLLKGEEVPWREFYQHEHSPCYAADIAYLSLTSNAWKYIWNPINGSEQLFDRLKDSYELLDLSQDRGSNKVLKEWRLKLAIHLKDRPEGWSNGEILTPRPMPVWRDPR